MTDFRALCAELILSWDANGCDWKPQHQARWEATLDRARAALAELAVRPSDEELLELAEQYRSDGLIDLYSARDFARAVLARYGSAPALEVERLPDGAQIIEPTERTVLVPVPRPIPLAERLPGPEDCDEGRCYWGRQVNSRRWSWTFSIDPQGDTHWLPAGVQSLPAHALPIPTQENADVQ